MGPERQEVYLPDHEVAWCINNNHAEYRDWGIAAPGDIEVGRILQAEFALLQIRYKSEFGRAMHEAPNQDQVKAWVESQTPSEEFYRGLTRLTERVLHLPQMASVLVEANPSQGIVHEVLSVRPLLVRFTYRPNAS